MVFDLTHVFNQYCRQINSYAGYEVGAGPYDINISEGTMCSD